MSQAYPRLRVVQVNVVHCRGYRSGCSRRRPRTRPRSRSGGDPAVTISAERPRLVLPGLLPADPSLERYLVHPGAVTAIELDPGDVLTVTDAEGRQRGELTVFAGGREDFEALGTAADTAATVLRALARPGAPLPPGPDGDRLSDAEAAAVIGPLAARGLDPEQARAVALFGEWSPAG